MATILLVDDHPLYHEGLASVFARLAPDLGIVSADSAEAGLALLGQARDVELALIDLVLPVGDGITAMALYAASFPHVPRVLISGKEAPELARRARDAGGSGFIPKSLPVDQLVVALRTILDGGVFFASEARQAAELRREVAGTNAADQLTLRQLEVLKLLGAGRSNKEISTELAIADRTVRAHLTELFRALGVSTRTQAVLAGQRLGLLALP